MLLLQNLLLLSLCLVLGKCLSEFGNVNNLIETSKCTIPDIPPFSPNLQTFVKYGPIPCSNFDPLLTYTTIKDNIPWLHIRNDVATKYFESPANISCCYSYVFRNGTEAWPDVGVVVSDCKKFQNKVALLHDTVWVSCSLANDLHPLFHGFPMTPIYENIHQVLRVQNNIREKANKLKKNSNKKPISVLIMVIDAVSRLNSIRTMPKTRNFIMENQFYEFKGYNKVDDNTFPNAMALLNGMNKSDSIKWCRPTEVYGLNYCPFIWKDYRNLGYATAYAEDWSQIATFNYLKKGFKNRPTDYYFKPYMDALVYLETKWQDTMPFCAGPESQGDRVLNLAYDFATTFKDLPSFGLFWMNTFSHNYINTPSTMDQNVKNFFKKLRNSGVLDESVVILLSDHGIRYGDINNTTRGFYEVRLPMNYISLPGWFKQTYPVETNNLKKNSKKLTSNYDLYMTLQHILHLSGTNYTIKPCWACPNCKSFFENIEVQRSCSDAAVDVNGVPFPGFSLAKTCNKFRFAPVIMQLSDSNVLFYAYDEIGAKKEANKVCSFLFDDDLVHHCSKFDSIEVKYPIRGHSYMECDKDMGLLNGKFRAEVPEDWFRHIERARLKPSPFNVEKVDRFLITDWTGFLTSLYVKKFPFPLHPVREIKIVKNHPRLVFHRDTYNGVWESSVIVPPKRKRITGPPLPLGYFYHPPVRTTEKLKDLQKLKQSCTPEAQHFLPNLKHL